MREFIHFKEIIAIARQQPISLFKLADGRVLTL
jgi:hypothetical protein